MAEIPTYFSDFLADIRLTESQNEDCAAGHKTLRERLNNDEILKKIIVSDFIQGSYRRSTAIRPLEESRSDVDIIVVTSLDKDNLSPAEALEKFKPFLEKYYKGKYSKQGRSWKIELSYIDLDLVPTAAPSEAEKGFYKSLSSVADNELIKFASADWKSSALWIPDRDSKTWEKTDPLTQIKKTQEKNKTCNDHFVNIVKALKWWRKAIKPVPKYPKSYPLEHLIYLNCKDGIDSIAIGIVSSLESIRDSYKEYALRNQTPIISDHGLPTNVFSRVSGEDFAKFHSLISEAALLARQAYDEKDIQKSADLWHQLFGEKFPKGSTSSDKGGNSFTPRTGVSKINGGRFA